MNVNLKFDIEGRNLVGVFLLLALLAFSLFTHVQITSAQTVILGNVVHVKTETELRNAVYSATSGVSAIIVLDRDIGLTGTTLTIPRGADVSLRSDNELARNSGVEFFRLFSVADVSTITVENGGLLKLDGIIVTHNADAYGSGVVVNFGGILTMYDGEISGNTANGGGGIYNLGRFSLYGGTITQNTADNGGGVANDGSQAYFTMSGGEITNNIASKGGGGLINTMGGTFSLFGGVISSNIASWGGGLYNYGSYFTMSGGEISNNIATNTVSGGGGIAFDGSKFDMEGGVIAGNRAPNGAGMYLSNGRVQLSGGVISNNTASVSGGGIYTQFFEVLYVFDSMVFANNQATSAYSREPLHDELYQTQIDTNIVWSFPFRQGYNNYDIGYTSKIPISDTVLGQSPNIQLDPSPRISIYVTGLLALITCITAVILNFYVKKSN